MNVVDSSGWLEYFADGPNASFFAAALEDSARLVVPSITLVEVYRRVAQQRGRAPAVEAVAAMQAGAVVDLDLEVAVVAGEIGTALRLPLADSIILATARLHRAELWTQDRDFEGIDGVRYRARA